MTQSVIWNSLINGGWRIRRLSTFFARSKQTSKLGVPGGRLFGDSLLCALAVHLQRRYAVIPPRDPKLRNGLPRTRLNRVIEYIEANFAIKRSR